MIERYVTDVNVSRKMEKLKRLLERTKVLAKEIPIKEFHSDYGSNEETDSTLNCLMVELREGPGDGKIYKSFEDILDDLEFNVRGVFYTSVWD